MSVPCSNSTTVLPNHSIYSKYTAWRLRDHGHRHPLFSLADNPEKARQLGNLMRERVKPYTWEERAKRLAGIMRTLCK